jgi:hypothetical protein
MQISDNIVLMLPILVTLVEIEYLDIGQVNAAMHRVGFGVKCPKNYQYTLFD